jgi:hypothetical protein
MFFSVIWSVGWFAAKIILTERSRPDGAVVNNAGRLRYTLVQYQVEFVLSHVEILTEALHGETRQLAISPDFDPDYSGPRDSTWYRDRLLHISSGLIGEVELEKQGIPKAADVVTKALTEFQRKLLLFDALWARRRTDLANGKSMEPDPDFDSRVDQLTELLLFVDEEIVNVVADVATTHANTLHWIFLVSGTIGSANAFIVAVVLYREIRLRKLRAGLNKKLLQLSVTMTGYLDHAGKVADCPDFTETFGDTALLDACSTASNREQLRTFLRTLSHGSPHCGKILVSLNGKHKNERVDCCVCGVNEGTSLLIGLQILETRRVSSYSFEHRTALSNQAESGTAATVTVIDDLSGDVASGMLSDALSNGSSISTEAAGTRSPAGEAYRL